MMKYTQLLFQWLCVFAVLTLLNFSCNSAQQSESVDTSADSTAMDKEGKMSEDKSKRPSPPAKAEVKIGDLSIVIDYSQPAVKGRNVFGEFVAYGEVWRTGANEATTITFDKDVMIEGQKLTSGTYALFTIPDEKEWIVIFNKQANQWGSFEYKQEEDALRIKVKPSTEKEITERVTFEASEEGIITLRWDRTKISFKVGKA